MRYFAALILCSFLAAPAAAKSFVYASNGGDNFLSVFEMNEKTGELTKLADQEIGGSPGPMWVSQDNKHIYISIRKYAQLGAYRLNADTGALTEINKVDVGAGAAYVALDKTGTCLLAAYYQAGKVTVNRVNKDGSIAKKGFEVATEQKAHSIQTDPSNRFVLVPHTGPNNTFQFSLNVDTATLTANTPPTAPAPEGTEPRHLQFHPQKTLVYTSDEKSDSISSYRFNKKKGTIKHVQTVSTLPEDFDNDANSCADIEISANGKFAFVSNRGHNSIAVFALDKDGGITALGQTPTEAVPRSFNITPSQKFLYAAGQKEGKLAAFTLDAETGKLTRFATYELGKSPSWVQVITVD
ncbi:MAG: lactonase family protein [Pirellulales bacterium]